MRRRLVALLVVALSTASAPFLTVGQTAPSPSNPAPTDSGDTAPADSITTESRGMGSYLARDRVSLWYGHSMFSGGLLGTIEHSQFALLGLRYERLLIPLPKTALSSHTGPTLSYTADVIPVLALSVPEFFGSGQRTLSKQGLSTHGAGAYPVGLQVQFRTTKRLQPFVAGHTGLLYLFAPLPDERGRQLNFAVGVGGGIQVSLSPATTITLGYRYHHLSNGFRGTINPGLDANLLYLSVGVVP